MSQASLRLDGESLHASASAWLDIEPGSYSLDQARTLGPLLVIGGASEPLGAWLAGALRAPALQARWQVIDAAARTLLVSIRPEGAGHAIEIRDATPADAPVTEPHNPLFAQSALARLTTDLSHELNNRINGIHVNAELIRMLGERSGDAKTLAAADRILSECRQSNALFDTLVTVGRVLFGHRAARESLLPPDLLPTFTRVAGGEPMTVEAGEDARISAQLTICVADICRVLRDGTEPAVRCELLSTDAAVISAEGVESDRAGAFEQIPLALEIIRASGGWLGWRSDPAGLRVLALLSPSAGIPDITGDLRGQK